MPPGTLRAIAMVVGVLLFALVFCVAMTGLVAAAAALFGRPVPHDACCSRCRHRLAGSELERDGRCVECGADLTTEDAIAWFRRRRRPLMATAGFIVLALALGSFPLAAAIRRGLAPPSVGARSDAELVSALAPGRPDAWLALRELAQRARAGTLSDKSIREVAAVLAPSGELGAPAFDWAVDDDMLLLLITALQAGAIDEAALGRCCDALLRTPVLRMPPAVRQGGAWDPGFPGSMRGTLERWVAITGVSADEGAPQLQDEDGAPLPRLGGKEMQAGVLKWDLPVGPARLSIDTEWHYVVGAAGTSKELKIRRRLDREVTVVPAEADSWVRLTDESTKAGCVEAAVSVLGAVLDRDPRDGQCVLRVDGAVRACEVCPISFKVVTELEGRRVDLGAVRVAVTPVGRTESGGPFTARVPCPGAPPPEITVVFEPDPRACEGDPDMQTIWGARVVRLVPLRVGRGVVP